MPERSSGCHRKRRCGEEEFCPDAADRRLHSRHRQPPGRVRSSRQWDMAPFGVEMGDRSAAGLLGEPRVLPRPLDENCAPRSNSGRRRTSSERARSSRAGKRRSTTASGSTKRLHEIAKPPKRGREALARVGRRLLADDAVESRRNPRAYSPGRIGARRRGRGACPAARPAKSSSRDGSPRRSCRTSTTFSSSPSVARP